MALGRFGLAKIETVNAVISGLRGVVYQREYDNGIAHGGHMDIDWSRGQYQKVTLIANTTIGFLNPPGVGSYQLKVVQTAGALTHTWSNVAWSFTAAQGIAATATTVLVQWYYDGTAWYQQGMPIVFGVHL